MRTRLASVATAILLSLAPFVGSSPIGATSALASTQTFTIPERNCPANAECDTAGVTFPTGLSDVDVSLTSSQWTNPSLAGKLVLWGIAYSTDGGKTWGPGICDSTSNTIGGASVNVPAWAYQTDTIGRFGRNGVDIGRFGFSGGGNMPPAGTLVRLFAWPQVAIPLGVKITVTS